MLPSKIRAEAQYKGRYKMNIRFKNAVKTIFIVTVLTRNVGCDKVQESTSSVTAPSNDNQQTKHDNNPNNNNYTNNEPLPNEPHNSAQTGHNGEYDPKNHYDSTDNAYDLGHNGGNANTDYDSHHYSGNPHQYSGNSNSNEYNGNGNQNTGSNNENTGNSNQNIGNSNQYTGNNNQYAGGNPFNSFAGGTNNLNSAYLNARHFSANSNAKSRLSNRIIQTRYGKLQGVVVPMDEHKFLKPVEVFLGVPYATPPVGSNRFSPTRTPSPWDGIRISDASGPACPQKLPDIRNESAALERMPKGRLEYLKRLLPYLRNQSEDCLYMNIYTPVQDDREAKRPVLVYIHGESFEWNSGNPYDGSVLASYSDMVVITINYRLGLFGFLNANPTPHLKARVANYGLMDQIAALHWVQQNIELFGGDPASVTLLGHGSGAACINFLMISPTVMPGLFHRAVLLSGSALSSWALVEDPVNYSVRLAREVNCSIPEDLAKDHEEIVDCLRESKIDELLDADVSAPNYLSAFGPSVDGVVIKTDYAKEFLTYFIPNDVQNYAPVESGSSYNSHTKRSDRNSGRNSQNRYDLLFGVVTSEALWKFSAQDIQNGFEAERRDRILRTYVRNAYTYHLSEIFFTVVNEYTDWERTIQQHPITMRDATVAALSDAQFVAPLVQTADLLSARPAPGAAREEQAPKTFFYVFDYQTKDGDYPQRMGTVHGEELPYLFGAPLVEGFNHFPKNYTKSEVALSEAFILYIANFARSGNPNDHFRQETILAASRERNRFRSIVWDEYDSVHQKYLEIGMKPRMKNHFRAHQLSVWLRLVPELHRAGMEDVVARHNLFRNHNDADLYDGVVRPDPLSRSLPYETSTDIFRRQQAVTNNTLFVDLSITTADTIVTTCVTVLPGNIPGAANNATNDPLASLEAAGYAAYSTALSVTIAIGCSLLILNVLIFAGVYYQRDKTRLDSKNLQHYNKSSFDPLSEKHGHYHLDHSQNASVIVDVETQSQKHGKKKNLGSQNDPHLTDVNFKGPHLCGNSNMQINSGALVKAPPSSPNVMVGNSLTLPHKNRASQKNMATNIGHQNLSSVATLPKNSSVHFQQQHLINTSNMIAEMHHHGMLLPPNGSATMHLSMPPSPPMLRRSDSPPVTQSLRATHGTFKNSSTNHSGSESQHSVPHAAMSEMRV